MTIYQKSAIIDELHNYSPYLRDYNYDEDLKDAVDGLIELYLEEQNKFDEMWYDMEELEYMLEGKKMVDVLFDAYHGNDTETGGSFNPCRTYFQYDDVNHLNSSDYKDYKYSVRDILYDIEGDYSIFNNTSREMDAAFDRLLDALDIDDTE
jgi:hypothetical protein